MKDDFSFPDSSANSPSQLDNELQESNFKTPEEVAADSELQEDNQPIIKTPEPKRKLTKKQKIILAILLIVVLLGLLVGAWMWQNKQPISSITQPAKKEVPQPTTEPSKLSGREVAPEVNKEQVTAVMIENSPDARPQSGLKDASVVFEAIAEGGVTRFMGLYQDTQPDYVGPIRSARPYYIEWLLGFDAAYAHVGGSPDAMSAIKSLGVKDLDQFYNPSAYQRVNNRYAPHNVYSGIPKLNELEKSKGYTSSNFTGFNTKKEAPAETPTYKSIDARLSGYLYNPHWDYDKATNSYLRSQGGKPHTEEKTGEQISSKVVILMVLNKGVAPDGYHVTYATNGNGKVYIFQDGGVVEGTWSKTEGKSQISFLDPNGKQISLNPGQRWITIVASTNDVVAKP
jgi:hypothetical protein